eukprot:10382156-Karenia_brevis.AAC.1
MPSSTPSSKCFKPSSKSSSKSKLAPMPYRMMVSNQNGGGPSAPPASDNLPKNWAERGSHIKTGPAPGPKPSGIPHMGQGSLVG